MITLKTEITEIKKGQFTIRNRICDAGTELEVLLAQFVVEVITRNINEAMKASGGHLEELWSTRKITRPEGEN